MAIMDSSQHGDESSVLSEEPAENVNNGEGDSEGDGNSSTNGSTTLGEGSSKGSSRKEKFTRKESKYVLYLRLLVLAILLLAAIAICCVVYLITDGSEASSVESHYDAAAEKISGKFGVVVAVFCSQRTDVRKESGLPAFERSNMLILPPFEQILS